MPINQNLVDQIKGNQERGTRNPNVEVIRLEREIISLQDMLLKQMVLNQETLLKVTELMAENEKIKSEMSIWKRQMDIKQLERLHAIK